MSKLCSLNLPSHTLLIKVGLTPQTNVRFNHENGWVDVGTTSISDVGPEMDGQKALEATIKADIMPTPADVMPTLA